MDIKLKIGKNIKKYRIQRGWSQEKLADECNLDRTYITSVENGKRNLSIETLQKFAKGLSLKITELLD